MRLVKENFTTIPLSQNGIKETSKKASINFYVYFPFFKKKEINKRKIEASKRGSYSGLKQNIVRTK